MRETERDREFHGEITSTGTQSELIKPSHCHITNSSIYCRCKLTSKIGREMKQDSAGYVN